MPLLAPPAAADAKRTAGNNEPVSVPGRQNLWRRRSGVRACDDSGRHCYQTMDDRVCFHGNSAADRTCLAIHPRLFIETPYEARPLTLTRTLTGVEKRLHRIGNWLGFFGMMSLIVTAAVAFAVCHEFPQFANLPNVQLQCNTK